MRKSITFMEKLHEEAMDNSTWWNEVVFGGALRGDLDRLGIFSRFWNCPVSDTVLLSDSLLSRGSVREMLINSWTDTQVGRPQGHEFRIAPPTRYMWMQLLDHLEVDRITTHAATRHYVVFSGDRGSLKKSVTEHYEAQIAKDTEQLASDLIDEGAAIATVVQAPASRTRVFWNAATGAGKQLVSWFGAARRTVAQPTSWSVKGLWTGAPTASSAPDAVDIGMVAAMEVSNSTSDDLKMGAAAASNQTLDGTVVGNLPTMAQEKPPASFLWRLWTFVTTIAWFVPVEKEATNFLNSAAAPYVGSNTAVRFVTNLAATKAVYTRFTFLKSANTRKLLPSLIALISLGKYTFKYAKAGVNAASHIASKGAMATLLGVPFAAAYSIIGAGHWAVSRVHGPMMEYAKALGAAHSLSKITEGLLIGTVVRVTYDHTSGKVQERNGSPVASLCPNASIGQLLVWGEVSFEGARFMQRSFHEVDEFDRSTALTEEQRAQLKEALLVLRGMVPNRGDGISVRDPSA
jgi:hypothetical protein